MMLSTKQFRKNVHVLRRHFWPFSRKKNKLPPAKSEDFLKSASIAPHQVGHHQKSRIWDKNLRSSDKERIGNEEFDKHIIKQSVNQHFPLEEADIGDIYLFQYQICPYSGKVKAFLDYHDISYSTIEVNPDTQEELDWSKDYKLVPIARVVQRTTAVIRDSQAILGYFIQQMVAEGLLTPENAAGRLSNPEQQLWHEWVDMTLIPHLFPNICRTFKESSEAFSYLQDYDKFMWNGTTFFFKTKISKQMYNNHHQMLKLNKIEDPRKDLYEVIQVWADAIAKTRMPLHGGVTPDLADICVFGAIRAFEGLQTFRDILENTNIIDWYGRMSQLVGDPAIKFKM